MLHPIMLLLTIVLLCRLASVLVVAPPTLQPVPEHGHEPLAVGGDPRPDAVAVSLTGEVLEQGADQLRVSGAAKVDDKEKKEDRH